MKIALVTDQHFGARNDSKKIADHMQKFYDEVFFPEIDKRGIDTVINLGDTFDRRKYIAFTSLKRSKVKISTLKFSKHDNKFDI